MIKSTRSDYLDLILFLGSILALSFSILAAGSMAIIAGVNNFLQVFENARAAWTISMVFGTMGLLTIPGLYLSYRSIYGKTPFVSQTISPALFGLGIAFPFSLALGFFSHQWDIAPILLEPIAHVLAALTPMLFMSMYVIRQLPQIPWRRIWGQFTAGLWISPFIALVLELLTAIPLVVLLFAFIWTEVDPREFIEPLTTPSPLNETYFQTQIESALQQPLIIVSAVSYVTILVPLLEELIKSIVIWPMLRRGLQPLYAFTSGTIAGGAYGLFEAFFLAQPGEDWGALMIARAGATFMHMITTGMVSLGLAMGLERRKWRPALRYYFFAVLLHGIWNLLAIGLGLGYIFQETSGSPFGDNGITALVIASGALLSLLTAGALFGLHAFPKYLLQEKESSFAQETSAGVS